MDIRLVLDSICQWRLPAPRWAEVDEALTELEGAVGAGDENRARRAMSLIGLLGPEKVARSLSARLDEPRITPAPPQTMEIINRLVHSLVPATEAPSGDSDDRL